VGLDSLTDLALGSPEWISLDPGRGQPLRQFRRPFKSGLAIAVGKPVGLDNTVTNGNHANLESQCSSWGSTEQASDLFRPDACINTGNSGGPLLNAEWRGGGDLTNAGRSRPGSRLGFANPRSTVPASIATQLLADPDSVSHPMIAVWPCSAPS